MATGYGRWAPPPPIWIRARHTELFVPVVRVEQQVAGAWRESPAALAALSTPWQPGLEVDRSRVSGQLRVTFPRAGDVVLLGRARGPLGGVTLDGSPIGAAWLGRDAGADLTWQRGGDPRGWHTFTARVRVQAVGVLDLHGAQLSLLVLRYTRGNT